jgi:hypothetical protein
VAAAEVVTVEMGKGRDKRKRNADKLSRRTKEEEEIVGALEAEVFWRMLKSSCSRPPSDPPVLGEPDVPVRAPIKPRPNFRSGAIAMREPAPESEFMLLKSRSFK